MPDIFSSTKKYLFLVIMLLAIMQVCAAGFAAFATRDTFSALSQGLHFPPVATIATLLATGVIIILLRISEKTLGELLGQIYIKDVRTNLYQHISGVPFAQLKTKRQGNLALRFVGDLSAIKSWVSTGLTRLISSLIVLPGTLIVLYILNPELLFVALIPFLVAIILMGIFSKKLAPFHRMLRSQRAKLAADISERLPMSPELALMGRNTKELNRILVQSNTLKKAAVARTLVSALFRALPELATSCAVAGIFWQAFILNLPAADVAAALAIMSLIAIPFKEVANIWNKKHAWNIAKEKCLNILQLPSMRDKNMLRGRVSGPINITFSNISHAPIKHLFETISAGKHIALLGGNGCGKSTILNIAAGLDIPALGGVFIGDQPIEALSYKDKSKLISYIGSNTTILKGSLRRALTMGVSPRPNDNTIVNTCHQYGLTGLLKRLQGLDGKIAEHGNNLSSGEKRRVQLVRAVLKQAPINLFDEIDDAIDATGLEHILNFLNDNKGTSIFITHNIALAQRLDEYWYIEGGEITHKGTGKELCGNLHPVAQAYQTSQLKLA